MKRTDHDARCDHTQAQWLVPGSGQGHRLQAASENKVVGRDAEFTSRHPP